MKYFKTSIFLLWKKGEEKNQICKFTQKNEFEKIFKFSVKFWNCFLNFPWNEEKNETKLKKNSKFLVEKNKKTFEMFLVFSLTLQDKYWKFNNFKFFKIGFMWSFDISFQYFNAFFKSWNKTKKMFKICKKWNLGHFSGFDFQEMC